MKCKNSITIIALIAITTLAFGEDKKEPLEQRAFVLAGYVPQFFNVPEVGDARDPFAEIEEETAEEQKKYEEGVIQYLKENGIAPVKAKYLPEENALLVTDTAERLNMYEIFIRQMFRPDMQLRAMKESREAFEKRFTDDALFKKDRLSRVALLGDTTLRAFHGEVRKLEIRLNKLPENHEEIEHVKKHLKLAKQYREKAVVLYLKSLEKEEILLREWQKAVAKLK